MRAVHHSSNVKTFNELKMSTHSNLITMICKKILLANENLTFRFSSALRFCILTGILLLLLFASNSSQDVDLFGRTLGPLVPSRVFLVPLDLSCLSHEAHSYLWPSRDQPRCLLPPSSTPDESSKIKQDRTPWTPWIQLFLTFGTCQDFV